MSRRLIFIVISLVVVMHFSIILLLLKPLYGAKSSWLDWPTINWCKSLGFQTPRETVALASFPGSGNTWLRYLLQQATGILTGSMYLDYGLLNHGFPAENIVNGTVLVVKTHAQPNPVFKAAVLLIRNPRDAILADFNRRRTNSHVMTAPKAAFRDKPKSKDDWSVYVTNAIQSWENFYTSWLLNFPGAIHIVFYEELVMDTETELKNVLHFLQTNVTQSDMACAMIHKQGIYKRKQKYRNFDPFTVEMYKEINEVEIKVHKLVDLYKANHYNTRTGRKL